MAEEVCLKHAHVIVTVSRVLQDELIERGVDPKKIVFYPNCIDPNIFKPDAFSFQEKHALRQRYNIRPEAQVITFVGTFGAWHGVEVLAEAIYRIISKKEDWLQKNKVHFLLVGDGGKMEIVKRILEQCNYMPYVTLTGLVPQNQAPIHLAISDILVSPHVPNPDGSRFFGSPTKLFEYMAMGKPILASELDQIGEILQESMRVATLSQDIEKSDVKYLALLCKPGSVDELELGIQFLVENPKWRKFLGEKSKEASKNYTWNKHVQTIFNKMSEIIGVST